MVSRLRRRLPLLLLAIVAALAPACEKVPLLAPSGSSITLTAASTALPVNGSTDIIAQVIEASGTPPHSGTRITFTTNLGTIQPPEADTDSAGRVVVRFVASSGSGTATITAISGGVSASGTNAIKIAVGLAAIGSVNLSASPTALSAAGGSSTISAIVSDTSGNTLPGVVVTFSTDNGSLSPTTATTNASGRAQSVLTTSRTAKVSATAGVPTTSGTTTTPAATGTVTVLVNSGPGVTISAPTPANPTANQAVSFTITLAAVGTTGSAVRDVFVDFGDGAPRQSVGTGTTSTVQHVYRSAGLYTVSVVATDINGDASSTSTSVVVTPSTGTSVTISAPTPANPVVNQTVAFTVTIPAPSATNAALRDVSIDFGDGSGRQPIGTVTTTVQHVYRAAGIYGVGVVATDINGIQNTSATSVSVSNAPPPTGTINAAPNDTTVGTTVTLSGTAAVGSSSQATLRSVHVDFADGSGVDLGPVASFSVPHKYQIAQTYTPSVTVTDSNGLSATAATQVIVATPAAASFTFSQGSAVTHTVNFDGSSSTGSGGSSITGYSWNFGDGSTGTGATTSHNYSAAGPFTVTLTITDSAGRTNSTTKQVTAP